MLNRRKMIVLSSMAAIGLLLCAFMTSIVQSTQSPKETPATSSTVHAELATLGGGCFWCVEAAYKDLPGVRKITSGFSGGHTVNPTYKEVCSGNTGHAEVVQIEFDPTVLSYGCLLEEFWSVHDPTTLNRQGHDVGTQYRSVIFYHSEAQKRIAEKSKADLAASGVFQQPIVTEIKPFEAFYPAEDYHQDYYANNPKAPYCYNVIRPKLEKIRQHRQAASDK